MAESGVMSAIQDFTVHTGGVVGVAAKHLETAERVSHNADTVFFTASTLKVPLLVELYRQVDAGIIDVNQRIDLTDALRVPGSGVLKELSSGLQPTVHDLAMLMIIISDNTAHRYTLQPGWRRQYQRHDAAAGTDSHPYSNAVQGIALQHHWT